MSEGERAEGKLRVRESERTTRGPNGFSEQRGLGRLSASGNIFRNHSERNIVCSIASNPHPCRGKKTFGELLLVWMSGFGVGDVSVTQFVRNCVFIRLAFALSNALDVKKVISV